MAKTSAFDQKTSPLSAWLWAGAACTCVFGSVLLITDQDRGGELIAGLTQAPQIVGQDSRTDTAPELVVRSPETVARLQPGRERSDELASLPAIEPITNRPIVAVTRDQQSISPSDSQIITGSVPQSTGSIRQVGETLLPTTSQRTTPSRVASSSEPSELEWVSEPLETGSIPSGISETEASVSGILESAIAAINPQDNSTIDEDFSRFAEENARRQSSQVTASGFAVELGTTLRLTDADGLWASLLDQHGDLLDQLDPRVMVQEAGDGSLELRLVAGPFANAADAILLCSRLRDRGQICRNTLFDGQRLSSR